MCTSVGSADVNGICVDFVSGIGISVGVGLCANSFDMIQRELLMMTMARPVMSSIITHQPVPYGFRKELCLVRGVRLCVSSLLSLSGEECV